MGQLANIFGSGAGVRIAPSIEHDLAATARLIPGSNNKRARVFTSHPEKTVRNIAQSGKSRAFADEMLGRLVPGLKSFTPAMLFQVTRDTVLIIAAFLTQSQLKTGTPNLSMLVLYLLLFLSFANQAKLYTRAGQKVGSLVILEKLFSSQTFSSCWRSRLLPSI